ncbi:DUF5053 domain-containing protein [Riemerella anatipestifer]|uniref:DUF5053 domain-containing protein n=1 Tax=Riemerella anatipestifer RA-CH-1 TaxID=1228997 RepID=J9R839_RIEAN|nr:DUF5053 domain-containing protein [Riemerella anatipestifer]AFR35892.1 hypothetical protein B739_1294 [Riemerella anatipestifer RA-CH-1]AZZ58350.1 DUF5053 domain-containing protein [Riemerella anatipestifer]MCO4303211.1 DUF5053 domain-containing protein [Riemerella anatipestifer]MCO7317781.1 DUF5053 domain-containing protein [Riemerella anatipestifer]MCO7353623.1 DUF5053 domain-containing protein [Riemerella anatipestifer]
MNTFETLKKEYLEASSKDIASEKLAEMKRLVESDPEKYGEAFLNLGNEQLSELKKLNVRNALDEVSDFISLSYVAEKYFGKTKSWLYQRINENTVNGKPAKFTEKEIETLNYALQDLSKKIGSVRIAI